MEVTMSDGRVYLTTEGQGVMVSEVQCEGIFTVEIRVGIDYKATPLNQREAEEVLEFLRTLLTPDAFSTALDVVRGVFPTINIRSYPTRVPELVAV